MVEVTKSNFEEMLPHIEQSINAAKFVAIDTEFTGLDLGPENGGRLFDSMEERYLKLKARACSFVPCQIGVSTFSKSPVENLYLVDTYIFYIRPYMCGNTDKRFLLQASCLDFLNKYDFDYNKFIKEGIPYVNENEEKQVCEEIKDGTIGHAYEKLTEHRHKKELDMLINNNFMKSGRDDSNHSLSNSNSEDHKRLIFPRDTICHEYYQIDELRRKYPSLWVYSENKMIVVEEVSVSRKQELLKKFSVEENQKLIEFYLGFTKVFRLLKDYKKPIVGHNLLMDLLLFFQNFHRPLPSSYKEFKKELHSLFPVIFDTRQIWLNVKKHYKLKEIPTQCSLFDLHEMFQNIPIALSTLYSPEIRHQNTEKYLSTQFPHESGYDSYVTGWVFIKICHVLAMKRTTSSMHMQPQSFAQYLKAVSPFVNKLNLGRSSIRYIDMAGEDPPPSIPDLLHIRLKNSKAAFNLIELSRNFDRYGIVEFKLIGNKSALLAVGNIRSYEEIMRDFKSDPNVEVAKYSAVQHSKLMNTALWLTAIGSCCVVAVLVSKLISS